MVGGEGSDRGMEQILGRMLRTLERKVDPSHAALIVVDVQNDFCSKGGAFDRDGADLTLMTDMFPRLIDFIEMARKMKLLIIFVQSIYTTKSNCYLSEVWVEHYIRMGKGRFTDYPALEEGSWGADFCKGFKPLPEEVVVKKHRYSAFLDTDLDLILRSKGIRTLIMTGVATNVCVEMTARIGFLKDYYIVLLKDCTATISEELHKNALRNIETHYGIVVDSGEVLDCWGNLK